MAPSSHLGFAQGGADLAGAGWACRRLFELFPLALLQFYTPGATRALRAPIMSPAHRAQVWLSAFLLAPFSNEALAMRFLAMRVLNQF